MAPFVAKSRSVRRPVLLLLLAALLAPASAAQACDVTQLPTLEAALPPAPTVLPAGRATRVEVTVTRAGRPAAGIDVFVTLRGTAFDAYRSGVTGPDGVARLAVDVPATARGAAQLDLEVWRPLVALPCATVEEHGSRTAAWGRAG